MAFTEKLSVKLVIWSLSAAAAAFIVDVGLHYLGWENTPGAFMEAVVTAGLMAYLFMLMKRLVLNPLKEIAGFSTRIKSGDLTARVHIESSREFTALSNTLNSMIEQLESSYNQLQEYSRNLEKLVEERTRQLDAERELHISMLTHDLKSPLTNIMGFSELMLSGGQSNLGAQEKDFTESILSNSKRLLEMVEEYLDLARSEAGGLKLYITKFEFSRLIKTVVSDLAVQANGKNLTIVTDIDRSVQEVEGDHDKISRMVTNLVNNAIKYTSPGGTITISAFDSPGVQPDSVTVKVADTGYGIPEDEIAHIFDKYYRSSSNNGVKGTGLGLAVVKSIVEAHSGKITVSSRLGEGSCFTLQLPGQTKYWRKNC